MFVSSVFSVMYSYLSKVREGNQVLNKHECKFKTPRSVTSKSESASCSLKNCTDKTSNNSLQTEECRGMFVQICFDIYSVSYQMCIGQFTRVSNL
jgi:hypothetical protein